MKTTITDRTILLSKKGLKELKQSIAQLEREKQSELNDLHNLDRKYDHDGQLARSEIITMIENIDTELHDKQLVLKNARLIATRRERLRVAIGSVVDLIDTSGRLLRFTIVNSIEANPSDGRISNISPLGRTLVGRTVKDIIKWQRGRRVKYLQLVQIH